MKKRAVTFVSEPHIVENNDGITDEEEALLFYSRAELGAIVAYCKSVITGQTKDECTRGLELMNNNNNSSAQQTQLLQRNHHKVIVRQIIKEQNRQRQQLCVVNPEELAQVAQELSAHRQKLALARGKQDAKAAKEGVWERIKNAGTRRSSGFKNNNKAMMTELRKEERRAQRAIRTRSGEGTTPRT